MTAKGSGLAARLRAAMERDESARQTEAAAAEAERSAARIERDSLFEALVEFGSQLPFLVTKRMASGVRITNGDRHLEFVEDGDTDVTLSFSGRDARETHRVYREAILDDRWVWQRVRGAREDRLPLFDQGLEVLMVHALGLPDPDAGTEATVRETEGEQRDLQKRSL